MGTFATYADACVALDGNKGDSNDVKRGSPLVDRDGILLLNVHCAHCPSLVVRRGSATAIEDVARPPNPTQDIGTDTDNPINNTDVSSKQDAVSFVWRVATPMDFDNVAFARGGAQDATVRFLACADCDQGPIGFQMLDVTATQRTGIPVALDPAAYVEPERVRYDLDSRKP